MAKKAVAKKGQLGDWLDEVPDAVQDAADEYDKAHTTAKSNAQGKLNTAKENLIENMRLHGIKKVRIRNGEKFLVVSARDSAIDAARQAEIPRTLRKQLQQQMHERPEPWDTALYRLAESKLSEADAG